MNVRCAAIVALIACVAGAASAVRAAGAPDPFLWLEDVYGSRALAWVKRENAKTLAELQGDRNFPGFFADAQAISGATDRIPLPELINGRVYNFWQDAHHAHGIWRTTTIAEYAKPAPAWRTVIDVDALAKAEGKRWVWHGADCESPSHARCLIALSEGGEDASTVREFDLRRGTFVAGGFVLPHGKQTAVWEDDDTLLVSRAWHPGDLTASGYPYIVKRLKRGVPLAEATEVFRGKRTDVSTSPQAVHDGSGNRAIVIDRGISFFAAEWHLVTSHGPRQLAIPPKSQLDGLVAGRLLFALQDPWTSGGTTVPSGALASVDLAAAAADPEHLRPDVVYAPGPRAALQGSVATRNRLLVTTTENVRGRAYIYAPPSGAAGWTKRAVTVPDNATIDLEAADEHGSTAYLAATGFLTPTRLFQVDAETGMSSLRKALKPKFDASHDAVQQFEATSKDGTRIPYFIVHPKTLKLDGRNPTILYAYGGFAVSETPNYSGSLGKLWLAHGGVYVLANIRGGGEFGPAWHDAGLKTHRGRVFDDFAAVARDLIARKITSPRHLGIEGGSNGGLLMGVAFTQHPELYHAVDIQVPLLDMLRYEKIAAGASWVGEYGTVAKPDERKFLASISPYQNLKANATYPEPFIWTTTRDDRVGPQHARKFAAALAALHKPYLYYEVIEGGHGSGANITERSRTTALEYTYFTRTLMP